MHDDDLASVDCWDCGKTLTVQHHTKDVTCDTCGETSEVEDYVIATFTIPQYEFTYTLRGPLEKWGGEWTSSIEFNAKLFGGMVIPGKSWTDEAYLSDKEEVKTYAWEQLMWYLQKYSDESYELCCPEEEKE